MTKAVRLVLTLCALVTPAALVAGCGGVPGNAVAEVDGSPIEKSAFEHWMQVAAKSSGQGGAAVPRPPDYAACVAQKRRTTPKPGKGQPKVTDAQLKSQCKQEYEQMRTQVLQLLITYEWLQGEADEMGIKVSDKDVRASFTKTKKQSFPKEADYQKFLENSGQTEQDLLLQVKADLLATKIRDRIVKGKDKVTDAQIEDFYAKNKQRFAEPERRDLRIVLTKTKAEANRARRALDSGQSWKKVAKRYSIDEASKAQGGKLPAQAKGTLEKALDEAVFGAGKGKVQGPVKTQFGYYVFEVTKVHPAVQKTLAETKETISQTLKSQYQQKAIESFSKKYSDKWKARTDCREGFVIQQCKNGPKSTPTPTPGQAPRPPAEQQQPGQ